MPIMLATAVYFHKVLKHTYRCKYKNPNILMQCLLVLYLNVVITLLSDRNH